MASFSCRGVAFVGKRPRQRSRAGAPEAEAKRRSGADGFFVSRGRPERQFLEGRGKKPAAPLVTRPEPMLDCQSSESSRPATERRRTRQKTPVARRSKKGQRGKDQPNVTGKRLRQRRCRPTTREAQSKAGAEGSGRTVDRCARHPARKDATCDGQSAQTHREPAGPIGTKSTGPTS